MQGMPSMEVHEGTEAHRGQGALTHYIQNAIWNGDSNDMLLQVHPAALCRSPLPCL